MADPQAGDLHAVGDRAVDGTGRVTNGYHADRPCVTPSGGSRKRQLPVDPQGQPDLQDGQPSAMVASSDLSGTGRLPEHAERTSRAGAALTETYSAAATPMASSPIPASRNLACVPEDPVRSCHPSRQPCSGRGGSAQLHHGQGSASGSRHSLTQATVRPGQAFSWYPASTAQARCSPMAPGMPASRCQGPDLCQRLVRHGPYTGVARPQPAAPQPVQADGCCGHRASLYVGQRTTTLLVAGSSLRRRQAP